MRCLVVEDHPLMREGLKRLLLHAYGGDTVEEACDAREAMARLAQSSYDLVLLDIDLPDRSGLDLLHDFRSAAPDTPVLVVSGKLESEFGLQALEAGAAGFVNKASLIGEILTAVRRVRSGKKYISTDLGLRLLEKRLNPGPLVAHEALSAREFEVLRLLGTGRTVSEVAGMLNLSVKTVSTYRTRVLEKLGLASTAQLIRYVMQHGLER